MAFASILLLDLILSGDNAILIAMACKNLLEGQRKKAMFIGCFGAVFIRVLLTLFATEMLSVSYLQFIGGVALLYIAVKLLLHKDEAPGTEKRPHSLSGAIKTIIVADFIMSMDNILSLAGVAQTVQDGRWSLILCGLLASVPLVLCGSQLFLLLMNRFQSIVYAGAAILAYTSGKLMASDQALAIYFAPYAAYMEGMFVIFVLLFGYILNRYSRQASHL